MLNSNRLQKTVFSPLTLYLAPLIILGSYLVSLIFTGKLHSVDGYYLIHYLYNYSHGFVARGLTGEIISRFFDTVTPEVTKGVVIFFSVSLLLSASLCIGKALTKVRDDRERCIWVLMLITLLCVMPITFRKFFIDTKLDKMLWALTLFSVFLSDRKIGVWLVPVLCITATLINPVFLFCSMILIAIILLQKFRDSGFKAKNGVLCAVSYLSMIAIGLYGSISEKYLGFSTPDEFIQYYFSRNAGGLPAEYERFATEWLFDYFEPLKNVFKLAYEIYFVNWGNGITDILNFVFAAIPLLVSTVPLLVSTFPKLFLTVPSKLSLTVPPTSLFSTVSKLSSTVPELFTTVPKFIITVPLFFSIVSPFLLSSSVPLFSGILSAYACTGKASEEPTRVTAIIIPIIDFLIFKFSMMRRVIYLRFCNSARCKYITF